MLSFLSFQQNLNACSQLQVFGWFLYFLAALLFDPAIVFRQQLLFCICPFQNATRNLRTIEIRGQETVLPIAVYLAGLLTITFFSTMNIASKT